MIQDLDPQLAKGLGVKEQRGAVVTEVVDGSAAAKAGIRRDDVIVAVNGKPVNSSSQLRNEIGLIEVGKSASLDLLREGKKRTVKAVIGEAREQVQKASNQKGCGLENTSFTEYGSSYTLVEHASDESLQLEIIPRAIPCRSTRGHGRLRRR